jgi:hypothetical protein
MPASSRNHPGFEWQRYAIARVLIDPHLSGVAVEHAKTDVAQRHAHQMVEQRPNDHFSYTAHARHKQPPSLLSAQRRSDPFRRCV